MPISLSLPTRAQVPEEATWDQRSVFPSDAAWEAACDQVAGELATLSGYRGRLGESPATLLRWLEDSAHVLGLVGRVAVYGELSQAVDTADQAAAARASRAFSLKAQVQAAVSFAEPELLTLGLDRLLDWIEQEPGLAVYRHYFERLELRRPHLRDGQVEELLAQVADPFRSPVDIFSALTNADLAFAPARDEQGGTYQVGQSSIETLRLHPDRQVRKTAWESYADGYLAFQNTLANCLYGSIKQDVFLARARGYASSLEAVLAPENIPIEVFHNLIQIYRANLPTWHRYWRVRRQALGYPRLHPYDIKAPLTPAPPQVSFEQAVDWICEGMAPLGSEYVDSLRRGVLEERWVDWAINQGKRVGAFSEGAPGTHPFIMMSHSEDLESLSTLAHELGHSLHSYFAWKTQPYVYSHYSLFVAEVASNFNQAMVRAYLLASQPDPAFQIALIEEAMSNFHRYLFLMPALARFELETHTRVERGQPLTAEGMTALMADLFAEGYGEEVTLDRPRVGITWAQFPHLYESYYVYQYATGIAAAQALAEQVLSGDPAAAARYLDFLRAGGSRYPLEALRRAGVDLTRPEPLEQAFSALAKLVDRLEELTAPHPPGREPPDDQQASVGPTPEA